MIPHNAKIPVRGSKRPRVGGDLLLPMFLQRANIVSATIDMGNSISHLPNISISFRPDRFNSHKDCSQFGLSCIRAAIGRISGRVSLKEPAGSRKELRLLNRRHGSEGLKSAGSSLLGGLGLSFPSNIHQRANT